jgi:hypothetical protein
LLTLMRDHGFSLSPAEELVIELLPLLPSDARLLITETWDDQRLMVKRAHEQRHDAERVGAAREVRSIRK